MFTWRGRSGWTAAHTGSSCGRGGPRLIALRPYVTQTGEGAIDAGKSGGEACRGRHETCDTRQTTLRH